MKNIFLIKNKLSKSNKGFTLLETLVAIMLFVVALSALLALVKDSVTSATYNKNELVATYLAQEGIDYVRNMRDEIVHVNGGPWSDFVSSLTSSVPPGVNCNDNGSTSFGCSLDVYSLSNKMTECPSLCPTTNISGKLFRRKITVMSPSTNDVVLVKVEVFWYNGTNERSRVLTTSLYNWAL